MSNQTLPLNDDLYNYLLEVSLRESDTLRKLREETLQLAEANMQIAPEQGQFMALLVQMLGARKTLEIGTFTGYSALVCAQALPADGRLVALDISEEWTAVGQRYWEQAGVAERIDLRIGEAAHSLHALIDARESGTFDFAFIDADKTGYRVYYELCLELMRPGGVIAFDNVLWGGDVIDPEDTSADTEALRELNRQLLTDDRIDLSMVPIGDGLTLARKRG